MKERTTVDEFLEFVFGAFPNAKVSIERTSHYERPYKKYTIVIEEQLPVKEEGS